MRRLLAAAAIAVALAGCGGARHAVPQSAGFTPPQSARTPEGAIPASPPPLLEQPGPTAKHISAGGLLLIERFEGFSSCPYPDPALGWRVPTRGFGETEGIHQGSPCITVAQATANLRRLVETRYEWALRQPGMPVLNQNQWDSACSTLWNLGAGIVGRGTQLGDLLRARNFTGYANALLSYVHAGGQVLPGLVTRRQAERALFLKPVPHPVSRRDLEARRRTLRRVLARYGCRRRRAHHQPLGPTCARWFREGDKINHELRGLAHA